MGSDVLVGIHCTNKRLDSWGDLDGLVRSRTGWWVPDKELSGYLGSGSYIVKKDVSNRGVELRGKSCKIVASMDDGLVFLEFEEDVAGCSADGHGKAGRCVALTTDYITVKKEPAEKKKAKKAKAVEAAVKKAKSAAGGKI